MFLYDPGLQQTGPTNHVNLMSFTNPQGQETLCLQRCQFFDFRGPNHQGPGTYTFNLTGASAGIAPDIKLTVLDVRLPE